MKLTHQPLSSEEKLMYAGEYKMGADDAPSLRVSVDKDGLLGITRIPDGVNRKLFALGNHEFYPTGAAAVRIRFDVKNGNAQSLTIIDGAPLLTAQRAAR
jgi:hypothetical protein